MLSPFAALALALLLSACTGPPLARFPAVDPRFAARVYIIAPSDHAQDRSAPLLIVDGEAAAALKGGQYTALVLQPGPHLLSTGCQIGWGLAWSEELLSVILDPRKDYFYQLAPGGTCGRHLASLEPSAGHALVTQTTYVATDQEHGA